MSEGADVRVTVEFRAWVEPFTGAVARLALAMGYHEAPRWLLGAAAWIVVKFGCVIRPV